LDSGRETNAAEWQYRHAECFERFGYLLRIGKASRLMDSKHNMASAHKLCNTKAPWTTTNCLWKVG
jgi:hypothetical protein